MPCSACSAVKAQARWLRRLAVDVKTTNGRQDRGEALAEGQPGDAWGVLHWEILGSTETLEPPLGVLGCGSWVLDFGF